MPSPELLDREQLGLLAIDTSPSFPLYIGIAASKLTLVADNMPVFAVESADCSEEGNFLIGSYGRLASSELYRHYGRAIPASPSQVYFVRREARVAFNNFFGTISDTENIQELSLSVSDTHYWCIPRREFCYKNITFDAFGGQGRSGDLMLFRGRWVFSAERGLVTAFAAAVSELCALGGYAK